MSALATDNDPLATANDTTFPLRVIGSSFTSPGIVVVFAAEGCGHCRDGLKWLRARAKRTSPEVGFVRVEVDEAPLTSGQYRIDATPTYLVFRSGRLARRIVGNDWEELERAIAGLGGKP